MTGTITVINNCGENTWLYMKYPGPVPCPNNGTFWKKSSGGEEVWTGGQPGVGTGYIRSQMKIGVPYHFCIPDKGAASGNFQIFMEPCKKTGDDCMIGTMVGSDRNAVNTLFEFTFGCMPGVPKTCKPSETNCCSKILWHPRKTSPLWTGSTSVPWQDSRFPCTWKSQTRKSSHAMPHQAMRACWIWGVVLPRTNHGLKVTAPPWRP